MLFLVEMFMEIYIDDLLISLLKPLNQLSIVSDSDFDVNKKRLNYIAQGLRAKGWDAPGV